MRPAVFLDRDGVVLEDVGFLHRVEDIHYIEGALDAIVRLNHSGVPVVVVTNQSGVGRGYYGWTEFEGVQEWIERDLEQRGGWLEGVWACADAPDRTDELDHSSYRKPGPGMLQDASSRLAIELASSWLIGDKLSDVEAAMNGGLAGVVHVRSGYGRQTRPQVVELSTQRRHSTCRIRFAETLGEAVPFLIGETHRRTPT